MRLFQASILVLVASLVAVSAKPAARPMFSEWLDQKTAKTLPSSVKPAAASPLEYDAVETEVACLKELGNRNCRCIGCTDYCDTGDCDTAGTCCKTFFLESTLGCCSEPDYGNYYYDRQPESFLSGLNNFEIGSCDITTNKFESPVTVEGQTGVVKTGTYTMICNVKHGGEFCGHPFCDSMVLTNEGTIFEVEQAISKSNPGYPTLDDSCAAWQTPQKAPLPGGKKVPGSTHKGRGKKTSSGKNSAAKKADIPAETTYDRRYDGPEGPDGPPETYYQSFAEIWTGPMVVTSRKYDIKYHEGFIEYTYWNPEIAFPVTEAQCNGKVLVNPFAYTLKFIKPHGY